MPLGTESREKHHSALEDKLKPNRWAIFGLVILSAALTVLYVSNVYQVNSLMKEVRTREKQLDELRIRKDMLNARVIELQSSGRITSLARYKLGMIAPERPPEVIKEEKE